MRRTEKIKAVILCGGQGTRIRDVSEVLPKPMLPVGGMPILWHIMKVFSHYGIKNFVLCLGYKSWMIKEFFLNYRAKVGNISLTLGGERRPRINSHAEEADWHIDLVETGENAMTGARVRNASSYLEDCERFLLTYGDGVANVDIGALLKQHKKLGLDATVTGVHPAGRFGEMETQGDVVREFNEKPNVSTGMINGGFMVFERRALDAYFRPGDDLILERDVMPVMVKDRRLGVYRHDGFWQCIDTMREYSYLNEIWNKSQAPWKVWK